jgi:hypothetical protein
MEARVPMEFIALRPVFDRLMRDPRLDVWLTFDGRPDLRDTYQAEGVADRVLLPAACEWRRFDLYLNADPWNPVRLRRCARRMSIFHGVAGKYDLDQPPRAARLFDMCHRVGFVNADRMRRYLAAGEIRPEQAALVGYPKIDRLVRGEIDAAAVRAELRLDPARDTVIYAPTWSPASSLHLAGEAIVGALLGLGVNVIAKLHDNCFMPGPKYAGDIDWRARLSRFASTGRFALATGADSSPYLAASDVLVTDHSSIGFEFLALDRPVVVFDAPDLPRVARINPQKITLLRSAADVVRTTDELADAVRTALREPGRHAETRRQVAGEIFYLPGTATERTVGVVYELLGVPPPASAMTGAVVAAALAPQQ